MEGRPQLPPASSCSACATSAGSQLTPPALRANWARPGIAPRPSQRPRPPVCAAKGARVGQPRHGVWSFYQVRRHTSLALAIIIGAACGKARTHACPAEVEAGPTVQQPPGTPSAQEAQAALLAAQHGPLAAMQRSMHAEPGSSGARRRGGVGSVLQKCRPQPCSPLLRPYAARGAAIATAQAHQTR